MIILTSVFKRALNITADKKRFLKKGVLKKRLFIHDVKIYFRFFRMLSKKNIRFALLSLVLSSITYPMFATSCKNPTPHVASEPPAYDADLYRKDRAVGFATAEFLYWVVNEGAIDYALRMNHPSWTSSYGNYAVGEYRNAQFDWSPGVRAALGYFHAPKYWDVFAQYTYLFAQGTRASHPPEELAQYLNGTWAQPDMFSVDPSVPLAKAKSHIAMHYNVLDLLTSRRFFTNEHLRFNLFGGISSAFIYQNWNTYYTDLNDVREKIRNTWQFEGLGLRLGVKLDWFLGWDFYLTGLASTGLLSGWYRNSMLQRTEALIAGVNNTVPVRNANFHDTRLTYTVQFMSGLSWQRCFEAFRFEALAGYEFTIWTNLHQIYRSSFSAPTSTKETYINSSDVSLQGMTLRFNLDY